MTALQAILLVLVAITGTIVVLIREPDRQALAASLFGVCIALLLFVLQAPDVALSQIVVGGVALPAMILLALGKIERQRIGAEDGDGEDAGDRGG